LTSLLPDVGVFGFLKGNCILLDFFHAAEQPNDNHRDISEEPKRIANSASRAAWRKGGVYGEKTWSSMEKSILYQKTRLTALFAVHFFRNRRS
jgi:hypothetical protein